MSVEIANRGDRLLITIACLDCGEATTLSVTPGHLELLGCKRCKIMVSIANGSASMEGTDDGMDSARVSDV